MTKKFGRQESTSAQIAPHLVRPRLPLAAQAPGPTPAVPHAAQVGQQVEIPHRVDQQRPHTHEQVAGRAAGGMVQHGHPEHVPGVEIIAAPAGAPARSVMVFQGHAAVVLDLAAGLEQAVGQLHTLVADEEILPVEAHLAQHVHTVGHRPFGDLVGGETAVAILGGTPVHPVPHPIRIRPDHLEAQTGQIGVVPELPADELQVLVPQAQHVIVQGDGHLAPGPPEPLVAPPHPGVLLQGHQLDRGIIPGQHLRRAVGAAVVHHDDLHFRVSHVGLQIFQQSLDGILALIGEDDDGQEHQGTAQDFPAVAVSVSVGSAALTRRPRAWICWPEYCMALFRPSMAPTRSHQAGLYIIWANIPLKSRNTR